MMEKLFDAEEGGTIGEMIPIAVAAERKPLASASVEAGT
jgi:hypothetical protein